MSGLNVRFILFMFMIFVVYVVFSIINDDKKADEKKNYLIAEDIYITGVVKQVKPVSMYRGGAIYLQNIHTNKDSDYECIFKDEYPVCKIHNSEAIILGISSPEFQPNDSIVFNTKTLKFKLYRDKVLDIEDGITVNTEDGYYDALNRNGYLDFSYYHRKRSEQRP